MTPEQRNILKPYEAQLKRLYDGRAVTPQSDFKRAVKMATGKAVPCNCGGNAKRNRFLTDVAKEYFS